MHTLGRSNTYGRVVLYIIVSVLYKPMYKVFQKSLGSFVERYRVNYSEFASKIWIVALSGARNSTGTKITAPVCRQLRLFIPIGIYRNKQSKLSANRRDTLHSVILVPVEFPAPDNGTIQILLANSE